jgi:ADP-heptose:LPS heptosyltransferase
VKPPLPGEPSRILLVKLRAIGDAVLTLPSLEALHRGFPRARITVLCPPAAAGIFLGDGRCAAVHTYDRAALAGPRSQAAFFGALRAGGFDLAVCLHASFRTALIALLSGARWRSVRNHSGPDWFSNLRAREPKEPKSVIQRDFDALRACGLDPKDERPRLQLGAKAKAAAARRFKAWKPRGRSVVLFTGAGKPEKRWPLASFLKLGRKLKGIGCCPLLLSAPGEPRLDAEAKALGGRAGQVADLKELGALCALAGRAIGNDSGPRHIAAASGARTLTLFGPEGLREWQPYRREDGHWALQAPSGRVEDLGLDRVFGEAQAWLKTR